MSTKIVVTDYEFPDLTPEQGVVAKAGLTLTAGKCKTEDELIALCADADGIVNQYAMITPPGHCGIEKLQSHFALRSRS